MRIILLFLIIQTNILIGRDKPEYHIRNIPEELISNSYLVIRSSNETFEIINVDKGIYKVEVVKTILREEMAEEGYFVVDYDQFRKVKDINAAAYDAYGNEIERLKKSDLFDQSYVSGFMDDSRIKVADLRQQKYPYTIEYSYEIEFDGLFYYPGWHPIEGSNISVQKSQYSIIYEEGLKPKFKEFDIPVDARSTISNGITWKVENLAAIEREPYGPSYWNSFPKVVLAPNEFSIDGHEGNLESWESLGKWFYKLNDGRDILNDGTVAMLNEMVANVDNEKQKVKIIYEYLQSRTRYVSVQLGIGGWQTFEASFVDDKGWGDCKGLTNYTKAMLKAVGISSNYALVKAGEYAEPMITDFPSNQFNHVILFVPLKNDTVWLECTSQQNAFGYLGTFTGNRDVLVVTEDGGSVVKTPRYLPEDNRQNRKIEILVEKDGSAMVQSSTVYTGVQTENNYMNFMIHKSPDEQKKWLYKTVDIPTFQIEKFSFVETKNSIPEVEEKIDISIKKYASLSGKRMFLSPNLMSKYDYIPKKITSRRTDVIIRTGFVDTDTIRILLPEGIYPEHLPESESFESKFGKYSSKTELVNGVIIYTRRFEMYDGKYPPTDYEELREFSKNVQQADKAKAVFMSKT